jgi:quinol monooxygenase YgiN
MTSSSSMGESPFALNAKISVLPEKRDAWLKEIKEDQKCSRRDEEGCLQFSLR